MPREYGAKNYPNYKAHEYKGGGGIVTHGAVVQLL